MKITLPNGAVIEGDDITPDFVMGLLGNDGKKSEQDSREMAAEFADIEARLSGALRDTLKVIRSYKMGVSTAALADELEITSGAASQRARNLVAEGLVERTGKGQYRAL